MPETEMTSAETLKTVNEITNKGVAQMTSLGEINLRYFERLAARQIDALNLSVEHGNRLMKLASESADFGTFVKGQVAVAKELGERVVSESKANMALADQARDDYRTWFEKNMAAVSADLRKGVVAA